MAYRQRVQLLVPESGGRTEDAELGQRRSYESYDLTDESFHRRKKRACSISANSNTGGDGDGVSAADNEDLNVVGTFCNICPTIFGFLFPNRSYPMDASNCIQIDGTHWVLDMSVFVGGEYHEVKEICIFLLSQMALPPEKALAVYAQSPGSQFEYCGAVHRRCPSAVLALLWPNAGGHMQLMAPNAPSLTAKIGICVEDLGCLPALDMGKQKQAEQLAMKVGENLFKFMQSFCSVDGNKLDVPMDILDRWFKRFQERSRRDPTYLEGSTVQGV